MTRSCIVCDNKYEQNYQLMFHKFPKDLKLKRVWCQVLNLSIDNITTGTYLCSEHFSTSDYFVGSNRLVKGATPKPVACFKTDNPILIKDEQIVNEEIIEIKNEPLWPDCTNLLNSEHLQNEISSNIDNFWVNPNLLITTSNVKQEFKYELDEFKANIINNEIDLPTIKEEVIIGNNGVSQFKTISHISRKNKFFCPVCRKYYASCKSRRNHFTKHFKKKIVLCYCGKYFTKAFRYSRHYFVHFVKNCDISLKSCTKEFGVHVDEELELFNGESNDEMPSLNRREIRKGEKPYKCQICSRQFVHERNLSRHHIHCGEEKPHQCEICFKRFNQKAQLTRHFRIHSGVKPYKCQICAKQFSNKSGLTEHIGVHGGEKPYQCNICSKQLSTKSRLTSHTRMHDEKVHKCETCLKLFRSKSNLNSHSRTHTGEKPFRCEICSKQFSNKSNLTCHSRTHTGEKPFRCETCLKHFTTKSHLTKHTKLHGGGKPKCW